MAALLGESTCRRYGIRMCVINARLKKFWGEHRIQQGRTFLEDSRGKTETLRGDLAGRAASTMEVRMSRTNGVVLSVLVLSLIPLVGCQELVIDKEKLLRPGEVSEVVGFLAGFGTTFAAVPDLLAMLRRKSSEGMNPRMGTIMGAFQVLWVYYGLLIASRPVILWNVIAVLINFGTVGAFAYYLKREKQAQAAGAK